MLLFSPILEDLQQVKLQFWDEMSLNNNFSPEYSNNHWFIQSRLVLLSGKLGNYDFTGLKPVAVAVELLDIALYEHYKKVRTENRVRQNNDKHFALIRGDYLYARALKLVSALGDCQVVRFLSQAIADISEANVEKAPISGMSIQDIVVKFRKLASLYVTSASLGALLSEVMPSHARILKDFCLNLGLFYEAGEETRTHFFKIAKEKIHKLPQEQYHQMLEKLLDFS